MALFRRRSSGVEPLDEVAAALRWLDVRKRRFATIRVPGRLGRGARGQPMDQQAIWSERLKVGRDYHFSYTPSPQRDSVLLRRTAPGKHGGRLRRQKTEARIRNPFPKSRMPKTDEVELTKSHKHAHRMSRIVDQTLRVAEIAGGRSAADEQFRKRPKGRTAIRLAEESQTQTSTHKSAVPVAMPYLGNGRCTSIIHSSPGK